MIETEKNYYRTTTLGKTSVDVVYDDRSDTMTYLRYQKAGEDEWVEMNIDFEDLDGMIRLLDQVRYEKMTTL